MMELLEIGATNTVYRTYAVCLTSLGCNVPDTAPSLRIIMPAASACDYLKFDELTADWVVVATNKLEALSKYRRNWDSYGGLPLSPNARRITFDALQWLKNQKLPVPAVVLGSGGTVHLEWRSNGKKLELGFGDKGMSEYLKVDPQGNGEEAEDAEYADEEAREKIETLADWLINA